MRWWQGLFNGRFGRLLRYLLVGGGIAFFYSALTFALVVSGEIADPTLASALATLMTQPLAFFAHRAITYSDVQRQRAQIARFAIVATCSFVVGVGTMKTVVVLGQPFWLALVLGWALVPAANYLVTTLW